MHRTIRQKAGALVIRAVDHWHPEVRPDEQVRAMKPAWGYSDHRERVLVYMDRGANDARIRIEITHPKTMTQDDVGSGVRPAFIGRMKNSAVLRLYSQHVEVVPGDSVVPAFVSGISCGQARVLQPVCGHVSEG